MHKQFLSLIVSLVLTIALPLSALATEWSVKADYAESCSCNPSCPCIYGSPPTRGFCDGTSLVVIEKGHYGDVNLDGLTIVSAFGTGQWVKYFVSENATDQQLKIIDKLMPAIFGYHKSAKVLATEKAAVKVERTPTNLKYSAPDTMVEIERMKGADGGPIKLTNLPIQGFPIPPLLDAEQYKSVTLSHQSKDKEFSYSGTNGFVAIIDASGMSD